MSDGSCGGEHNKKNKKDENSFYPHPLLLIITSATKFKSFPLLSLSLSHKVLHGADSDIVWLQRDFSLYLVNLFDTGQAMRVLGYPRFSLAYLLSSMCGVTANKAFQLADWRIRCETIRRGGVKRKRLKFGG